MAYYLGIDIGSSFSKAVVLDGREIVSYEIIPSGGDYKRAADNALSAAVEKAGIGPGDVDSVAATGYGSSSVTIAGRSLTDISCTSRGVHHLFPLARTIIDIGSQYSRVIKLDDRGRNTSFLLSDKCAGGSGRFLQTIAHVLELDFDDIGPLSLKSENPVSFNTGCAVFAETEAISRIAEGARVEDILAGVHIALSARIGSLVERQGMQKEVAITGGGAKDTGLVASLEEVLGTKLLIADEPQIVTAIGAALFAGDASA